MFHIDMHKYDHPSEHEGSFVYNEHDQSSGVIAFT